MIEDKISITPFKLKRNHAAISIADDDTDANL